MTRSRVGKAERSGHVARRARGTACPVTAVEQFARPRIERGGAEAAEHQAAARAWPDACRRANIATGSAENITPWREKIRSGAGRSGKVAVEVGSREAGIGQTRPFGAVTRDIDQLGRDIDRRSRSDRAAPRRAPGWSRPHRSRHRAPDRARPAQRPGSRRRARPPMRRTNGRVRRHSSAQTSPTVPRQSVVVVIDDPFERCAVTPHERTNVPDVRAGTIASNT